MIRYMVRDKILPATFCDFLPRLQNRSHCLILDRDGTLVPLTNIPSQAVLSESTTTVINELARLLDVPLVILSARGLNSLRNEFDPSALVLAGNYGLEISFPTGQQYLHPQANSSRVQLLEVFDRLEKLTLINPLLYLDNHELSLCLHYHNLAETERDSLHLFVQDLHLKYSSLWFRKLPTSYEIVPPLEWTKAKALDKISEELSLDQRAPFYITFGDSDADEPMFQWTNERGGISFNVGTRTSRNALGIADKPGDVIQFLTSLAELVRSKETVQNRDT